MGFSTDLILPGQEGHYSEFTCAVCFNLVEGPLLTKCQHIFCTACLQDWFDTKPSCPSCTQELDPRHGAGELHLASPLAHRVLGRIRVKCSLPNCPWVGEYSEVTAHLTSSDSHLATATPMELDPSVAAGAAAAKRANQPASATPPTPPAEGADQSRSSAEALKVAGNAKFEQRMYGDAITLYTKAINLASDVSANDAARNAAPRHEEDPGLSPRLTPALSLARTHGKSQRPLSSRPLSSRPQVPTYYSNRAACYFCTGRYSECAADCQAALRLDPFNGKVYKRLARAHCEMGEFDKAKIVCEQGLGRSAADSRAVIKAEAEEVSQVSAWTEQGEAALANGDCSLARTFFANVLQKISAPSCKLRLVRAELGLGLCDRALRTTRDVIKMHPNVSEAYVLRGMALLLSSDLEQAQRHLREALRLDPDDSEAARAMKRARKLERHMESAKSSATARAFETAEMEYTSALSLVDDMAQRAPLVATLHAERASARLRLKSYDEALKDCALAIYAQDDCKSAWLTKAQVLHALGRHEEALHDMSTLSQTFQNDTQVSHAHQRASFEVRKAKRPDYYALLNVPSIASGVEIKQAYKQQALVWHPDKHSDSEVHRAAAEERFKLLGEALEILGDEFQRKLYNEGYDKAAIQERVQAANRSASNFDRDGCCNRGGGCGGGGCG